MNHDAAATSEARTGKQWQAEALSAEAPSSITNKPRDAGDAWVEGNRGRFWGRFGAAGVLAYDPVKGVLLQHRALWSHNGGTWGLPGGALHQDEDAVTGALREAYEEAALPSEGVKVLFTSALDLGYWSYSTVVVQVTKPFDPVISDPESIELRWVPVAEVGAMDLHPGLAATWNTLSARMLAIAGQ